MSTLQSLSTLQSFPAATPEDFNPNDHAEAIKAEWTPRPTVKLNHFPPSPTPWKIEALDRSQTMIADDEGRRVTTVPGLNQQSIATAAYIVECVNLVAAAEAAEPFHPAFRHLLALREAVAELVAAKPAAEVEAVAG